MSPSVSRAGGNTRRTAVRSGTEGTAAAIVDKSGWLIGEPLGRSGSGMKIETCALHRAHDKHVSERNSVLQDRRTDLYP